MQRAGKIVLVVSNANSRRVGLASTCRHALPQVRVEELSDFTDLVQRVVEENIALVVLDLDALADFTDVAPSLLRYLGPTTRLVAVREDSGEGPAAIDSGNFDVLVTSNGLADWLYDLPSIHE